MSKNNKKRDQKLLHRSIAINLAGTDPNVKPIVDDLQVTGDHLLDSKAARIKVLENISDDMPICRLLDEMSNYLPSGVISSKEDFINAFTDWFKKQRKEDRSLFIRRYWNGESIELIAIYTKLSSKTLRDRLYKLTQSLKSELTAHNIGIDAKSFFLLLSDIGDAHLEKAQNEVWSSSFVKHWRKYALSGALLLMCFTFAWAYISRNFLAESIVYFRDCKYNWEDAGYSYDHLNFEYTHSTSRDFSWMWDKLRKEKVIPILPDYKGFECYGYYQEDESLQKLELRWKFLSYRLVGFRQIRATVAPAPTGELPDFFKLPLDNNGEPIPQVTTVTLRDGISIYAATESRATIIPMAYGDKRIRKMIFYKDGLWIELEGINCSPEHMNEVLNWFWDNKIDFSYFPAVRGY